MNTPLITMDREQAQEKLNAYRDVLRGRADAEYEAAALGYKALADGKPLLNLTEAIVSGGLHTDGRPKLAVARADMDEVRVRLSPTQATFSTAWNWRERRFRDVEFIFAMPGLSNATRAGFALVPMVPADKLPRINTALGQHLILWEVVQWADSSARARPDRDPYLLRHIVGDLYAVVAEWDLTDLERAVMAGRVTE